MCVPTMDGDGTFSLMPHCVTFGGSRLITLNGSEICWTDKLKYLGCYFSRRNCKVGVDITCGTHKYFGNFNNISVVGSNRNEMATVHLV